MKCTRSVYARRAIDYTRGAWTRMFSAGIRAGEARSKGSELFAESGSHIRLVAVIIQASS